MASAVAGSKATEMAITAIKIFRINTRSDQPYVSYYDTRDLI
jgi:hypothetical protein